MLVFVVAVTSAAGYYDSFDEHKADDAAASPLGISDLLRVRRSLQHGYGHGHGGMFF